MVASHPEFVYHHAPLVAELNQYVGLHEQVSACVLYFIEWWCVDDSEWCLRADVVQHNLVCGV